MSNINDSVKNTLNYTPLGSISKILQNLYSASGTTISGEMDKIRLINSKYKIPEQFKNDFNNLVNFSYFLGIKDIEECEKGDAENYISKDFGDLLLKYYNRNLTNDDILHLLQIVQVINQQVKNKYNLNRTYNIDTGKYGENIELNLKKIMIADIINNFLGMNVYDGSLDITQGSYSDLLFSNFSNLYLKIINFVNKTNTSSLSDGEQKYLKICIFVFYLESINKIVGEDLIPVDNFEGIISISESLTANKSQLTEYLRNNTNVDAKIAYLENPNISDISEAKVHEGVNRNTYWVRYTFDNPLYINDEDYSKLLTYVNDHNNGITATTASISNMPIETPTKIEKDIIINLYKITDILTNDCINVPSAELNEDLAAHKENISYYNDETTLDLVTSVFNIIGDYTFRKGCYPLLWQSNQTGDYDYIVENDNATHTITNFFGLYVNIKELFDELLKENPNILKEKENFVYYYLSNGRDTYYSSKLLDITRNTINIIDEMLETASNFADIEVNTLNNFREYANNNYLLTPINNDIDFVNSLLLTNTTTLKEKDEDSDNSNNPNIELSKNNNLRDFDTVYNDTIKSSGIIYSFSVPNNITITNGVLDMDAARSSEKRSASDIETYYMQDKSPAEFFDLKNILVKVSSNSDTGIQLMTLVKELMQDDFNIKKNIMEDSYSDYITTARVMGDTYYKFSISVLYKEFNPYVRDLCLSSLGDIIYSDIAQTLSEISTNLNSSISLFENRMNIVSPKNFQIFTDLRANPYTIRSARNADIVSYYVGKTANIEISADMNTRVNDFLYAYTQVRDYYYRVLRNDSFVRDECYKLYEKLFIIFNTFDQIMNNDVDVLQDINKMSNEDCDNFMISYGLEQLVNQIKENNFSDSLLYKRRLIAKYADLMSLKGSRAAIDSILDVFNYSDNLLEINKYLIYNTYDGDVVTPKFIPIPYDTKNTYYYIENFDRNLGTGYDIFIADDPYWTSEMISADEVSKLIESPQPTKYLQLKFKKDLYETYIRSQYAVSAESYLSTRLWTTLNGTEFTEIIKNIKIRSSIIENTSLEMNLSAMFELVVLLFMIYTSIGALRYTDGYSDVVNPNAKTISAKLMSLTPTGAGHIFYDYLGINPNAKLGNLINNIRVNNEIPEEQRTALNNLIEKSFKAPILKYENSKWNKEILDGIFIYNPINYVNKENDDGDILLNTLGQGQLDSSLSNEFIVYKVTSQKDNTSMVKDNENWIAIKEGFLKEYSGENALTAIDEVTSAFSSISYINFINLYFEKKTDPNDAEFEYYDFKDENQRTEFINGEKALSYYFKFVTPTTVTPEYPPDYSEYNIWDKDYVALNDFYNYIFNTIVQYPVDYMLGKFTAENCYYTDTVKLLTDAIFNEYFTCDQKDVENLEIILTDETGEITNKEAINQNARIIKKHVRNMLLNDNADISTENLILQYVFGDVTDFSQITSERRSDDLNNLNSHQSILGNIKYYDQSTFESIQNKLLNSMSVLSNSLQEFENLNFKFFVADDVNRFLDFVMLTINYFISYTTAVSRSDVSYSYDAANDSIPYADSIRMDIGESYVDHLFYDEKISWTEEENN